MASKEVAKEARRVAMNTLKSRASELHAVGQHDVADELWELARQFEGEG